MWRILSMKLVGLSYRDAFGVLGQAKSSGRSIIRNTIKIKCVNNK